MSMKLYDVLEWLVKNESEVVETQNQIKQNLRSTYAQIDAHDEYFFRRAPKDEDEFDEREKEWKELCDRADVLESEDAICTKLLEVIGLWRK